MKGLNVKTSFKLIILLTGISLATASCQKDDVLPEIVNPVANAEDPVKDKEVVPIP